MGAPYKTIKRRLAIKNRSTISRTNDVNTCLYCGKKLRTPCHLPPHIAEGNYGDYADNAFCDRCGYAFGVAFAMAGKRLEPYEGDA